MSEIERRFHESWLGMIQPSEGLVVSIPVLVDRQCMARAEPEVQRRLRELCPEDQEGRPRLSDLAALFADLLGLEPAAFDGPDPDTLPPELALHVPEGKQTLRPTLALRRLDAPAPATGPAPDDAAPSPEETPAARAGARYEALVWDLAADPDHNADGADLDRPEARSGPWEYPPAAKLERLLRHCRVPIGLLTNRRELRLIYAPHGESSGSLTFRFADMCETGGRPLVDAFVMLLHQTRWFGVEEERALPAILAESRRRQAEVTNALAEQVYEAAELLLGGLQAAAERDGPALLEAALAQPDDHLYRGLLTVLLRLVFTLYAEARDLLPLDHPLYAEHYSVLGLFDQLQADAAAHPDAMSRRFGAWPRLVAAWRAIYRGVEHRGLRIPPHHGDLFDPSRFPFLEGWGYGGASPLHDALYEQRAEIAVPSIDDGTILRVLQRLLFLERQRLSYSALDVEQIGSVYEALMGYHVVRLPARAACLRPQRAAKVWVSAAELLAVKKAQRDKHLKEVIGLTKAQAARLARDLEGVRASDEDAALAVLADHRLRGSELAPAGRLVIQPGDERRRTSSHYTPRTLTEPIARRTLAPLLAAIGPEPPSEALLALKICDPAMGSGAFLVAVVRALADQVVAAWTREGRLPAVAQAHGEPLTHARRLVAQRCVYGVDKNPFAVELAKLSLWLVTLARGLPFTFVDHALRCGDSLVGLSLDQLRAFHWDPGARQQELLGREIHQALEEAVALRREICDLAEADDPASIRARERALRDADDATSRLRLIGDLIVGAFFMHAKERERERERARRLELVDGWLRGGRAASGELLGMQAELRRGLTPFHWMIELPEVFFSERADPLEGGKVNRAALMDGFVGNPPFLGGKRISTEHGDAFAAWLEMLHQSNKNADLSAHFFRRADSLLGEHGTIGMIATNTIGQGDTRKAGLQYLVNERGYRIYDASRNIPWPAPGAAVTISVVHLARGSAATKGEFRAEIHDPDPDSDDPLAHVHRSVEAINSRLRPRPERDEPQPLVSNAGLGFVGSFVLGMGFVLTPEERDALVGRDRRNADRVLPYIGGEEVNTNHDQSHERYVINFGQMDLAEAEGWPDLLDIVRRKVKPERDKVKRDAHRKYWWRYADCRPGLYQALTPNQRCLVTSAVSKHLLFSFQQTDRIFSHKLIVFPLSVTSAFAVLQSRIHERWTWLLSSTLETRLNYSASDCFENFPFPKPDPRAVLPELEAHGERLYEARAAYMRETEQGLTKTYNALKDPAVVDPPIVELRRLHEELDRAVLRAYGWDDLPVPPFHTPQTPAERRAFEAFEDEVIDRLFALNAARAAAEAGAPPPPTSSAPRGRRPSAPAQTTLAGTDDGG